MTRRIAIFGGTFDPPHLGHVRVLEIALEEFGGEFDEILIMPSNLQYYKEITRTSAEERLEMCMLAFGGIPRVRFSMLDINRGGVTYSVDTLHDVQSAFGPDVQVTFILGSDSFETLPRWKAADELAEQARFVVVGRGQENRSAHLQDACGDTAVSWFSPATHQFSVQVSRASAPAISSTTIRRQLGHGEIINGEVPDAVLWYIQHVKIYGSAEHMTMSERKYSDFVAARKADLQARVSEYRYRHSLGVADTAVRLAGVYGVDQDKAYLAGILHDWDKNFDDDGIRARAKELGVEVSDEVLRDCPQTLHGLTAAAYFSQAYPEIPADVIQAISRHTTGAIDMSDLDMVLYIADSLEPGRTFPKVDELRALVGTESLEELFLDVQAYLITSFAAAKKTMHPDTLKVWNYYASRHRARKGPLTNIDGPVATPYR